jgi:UDP-2,4-diacetamido-2,4,6-trideoxy-beta-L-altropyranose hydrolase
MAKLVILTEAGDKVGFGHLKRCLAIAKEAGASIYVHSFGSCPLDDSINVFPWLTNLDKLISEISPSSSVIIDSYLAERQTYKVLSNHFKHVTVIDDFNRLNYPVSLIINPGIEIPDYQNQRANIVSGNEYIILRDEITQQKKKTNYHNYKNLLVTFGGGYDIVIFDWLIPLLDNYFFDSINIIVGNEKNRDILSSKFQNYSLNWYGQVNANKVAKLMFESDICISAGGQTLHELAFIGVPTICIETGKDQTLNISGYIESGFLIEKLTLFSNQLSQKISFLLDKYSDDKLRKVISEKGKTITKGQGASRIVSVIAEQHT